MVLALREEFLHYPKGTYLSAFMLQAHTKVQLNNKMLYSEIISSMIFNLSLQILRSEKSHWTFESLPDTVL